MTQLMTIERFILQQQARFPDATGTLTNLLYDIALAAKLIASEIRRFGLGDIVGAAGTENVHGERQQKLDVFADEVIVRMNDHTGRLAAMASEEHEEIIEVAPRYGSGKYVLLYDPLDGSSNIDVNVSVGTIFSVHRRITSGPVGTLQDLLQPGRSLAVAGYVIYGSSTMLVYSTGTGVHGFTLDLSLGEFLLSHPNMRFPEKPLYYSANHGHEKHWTPGVRRYVKELQGLHGTGKPPLSHRYTGSLVADFHRNLLRGGVFVYPGEVGGGDKPNGKLRLTYEGQAVAFIAEQAGGRASDGIGDLLDIQPHTLHQRTPCFVGNKEMVDQAEEFVAQYDHEWRGQYLPYRQREAQLGTR
ncbi:MAG: class 1 fructose-bisphosphatase [Chloroflexi bacterium]|nr:Fructose-1,6-bisphosphatase class 1 [Anaerolineae bacterium]RIK18543.1 MAG: class 1 fructose-bisphosphatase [Chloroflexota bacterium]